MSRGFFDDPTLLAPQRTVRTDIGHDLVKTPATAAGLSKTTRRRSVRFLYLMPASAVAIRMPSIGGREA